MNPTAALVDAFAARLDAELVTPARDLNPDAVLVWPDHRWRDGGLPDSERDAWIAEQVEQGERSCGAGLRGYSTVNPAAWPKDVPLPLTLGAALDVMNRDRADVVAELAREVNRCARELVDPKLVDALLASAARIARDWPWPDFKPLQALRGGVWGMAPAYFERLRRWANPGLPVGTTPAGVTPLDVARWAAPKLERAERQVFHAPGYVPMAADWLDFAEHRPRERPPDVAWIGSDGKRVRFPFAGLAILYRAVLLHTRATFAAGEAHRAVRAVADAPQAGEAIYAALDAVLAAEAKGREDAAPDPLAQQVQGDDGERGRLADDLLTWTRTVRELFSDEPPATEEEARATAGTPQGPALWLDVAFAQLLTRTGGEGAKRADVIHRNSAARTANAGELWALWPDTDAPWLRILARALWADVWRPALVRERRPVAVTVTGLDGVVRGALAGVAVGVGKDGRPVLLDREGRAIARFEDRRLATAVHADALEALARAGTRELATVAAARFVTWFAHQVQRRDKETDPLVFEGADGVNAYGTVAAAMGMDPEKHANAVRGLLHALNCAILAYPDGSEAGVLMLDYRANRGRGNRSRLVLTPGRPWLSVDVFKLPQDAEYRALAPILHLDDYGPPFVGDARERGPQARLYLRLLAELAREAPDIARGLGAHIPGDRWAAFAREEGVLRPPPLLVGRLQDRWTRDGDEGPAVFERVGPDRWHLAPAFAAEREMLEAGGKLRIGASKGGQLAAKQRAEARTRLADGMCKRRRRGKS